MTTREGKDASGTGDGSTDSGFFRLIDGAVGAGLVLVVLPCIALYFGVDAMAKTPVSGLPVMAIFGIMILFGSLALVSALFRRLGLGDPNQALALPEGSVRAAIALALIVLFAIISIMLYQSLSKSEPYRVEHLREAEKTAVITNPTNRVIAVVTEPCAKPVTEANATCSAEDTRFSVHLLSPQPTESTDLAKQLLILIGTLMTSVTSFYFASRTAEPKRPDSGDKDGKPAADDQANAADSDKDADVDGCNVPIEKPTHDADLPPAQGGVA